MKYILSIIPFLLIITAFILLRFNGKKELLKMDLVQFLYAFVFAPLLFLWIKFFVFYNLKAEIGVSLDVEEVFLIDAILTLVFIYTFAFIVIHSLTKTFQIHKNRDPLYDLFAHSEYFHQWFTHLAYYSGELILTFILGVIGNIFPFELLPHSKFVPYLFISATFLSVVFYLSLISYDTPKKSKFINVMRLQSGLYASILLALYIWTKPSFTSQYGIYWASLLFHLELAAMLMYFQKNKRLSKVRSVN